MSLKAVIFDLDDTLYDYTGLERKAVLCVADSFSERMCVTEKEFLKAFLDARSWTKQHMRDCASRHNRMIYFQRTAELSGCHPLLHTLDMYECYWDYILENMKLAGGAGECLAHLKKEGIRIAVCTDLTAHIQHRKLRKLQIEKYVDVFVSSEEADAEKPERRIFEMVLDKLKLSAAEAVHVGDSYRRDIEGAAGAGIFPVWITEDVHFQKTGLEMKTVRNFAELEEFLFWKKGQPG